MTTTPSSDDLDLYHRTSPEAAEKMMREQSMFPEVNADEVYFSNRLDGAAGGYGSAVVQLRVPAELVERMDELPDGEQRYQVRLDGLRTRDFVRVWGEDFNAPTDDGVRELAATVGATRQQLERLDQALTAERPAVSDFARMTARGLPVAAEPGPPEVDLDLGAVVYRQAAARGGFTPESTAAAEVTIERAVTSQQTVSSAGRLHALAEQVETAHANRTTTTAVSTPPLPASAAPPPQFETARARAVSAQIWDDTRDEYDPPAVDYRR